METQTTIDLEPDALLAAWLPFRELVGVTSVRTAAEHARALNVINSLVDSIGEDEDHPLADVLDFLAEQVRSYEGRMTPIPDAPPHEILRFLMNQHGLRQSDLAEIAPQGRISDLLAGRRGFSKDIAKALATRFQVGAEIFL